MTTGLRRAFAVTLAFVGVGFAAGDGELHARQGI